MLVKDVWVGRKTQQSAEIQGPSPYLLFMFDQERREGKGGNIKAKDNKGIDI